MRNKNTSVLSRCVVLALFSSLHLPLAFAQEDDDPGFKYIEVKVLDLEGQPLVDAAVEVSMDGIDFPLMTDEEGITSLNVPSTVERSLTIGLRQDGYAAVGARWNKGDKVPDELSIKAEKGVAIGGIVHDEQGNPVEGVEVEVSMSVGNTEPGELRPWFGGLLATTDEQGRWRTETAPEKELQLYFRLAHPDYIRDQSYGRQRPTWNQLKSLDYVFTVEKGIEIRGKIVDSDDQLVVGASVTAGLDRYTSSGENEPAETDENGEYLLKNVKAGRTAITVMAEGFAPEMRKITASKESEPQNFQLQPGHHIRFEITDPDGQPLAGVRISPESWRGNNMLVRRDGTQETDADGVWQWDGAPADEVQYNFYLQDYMSVRDKKFTPSQEPYEITMDWPLVFSGDVVDAESGEPIEDFEIMHGIQWRGQQDVTWQSHNVEKGQLGKYLVKYTTDCDGYRIKIRAEGYRPVSSDLVAIDEGEVTLDFELEPGQGPSGVVRTPDGEPAEGTDVAMALVGQYMNINNGQLRDNDQAPRATADAEGRFKLPFPDDNYLAVFLHDSGWKQLTASQLEESEEVTLEAWSKLEGKLLRGQQPLFDERVYVNSVSQYRQGQPHVNWSSNAQTDGEGKFVFDRVRAGNTTVSRHISYGDIGQGARMGTFTHSEQVQLEPGQTAQVQIGGIGNTLKGKLTIPDDYKGELLWEMGLVRFNGQNPNSAMRNPLQALGKAIAQLGQSKTPVAAPPLQEQPRRYATTIAGDGTFEIHDVVPGQYQMSVQILNPPSGGTYRWEPIAMVSKTITVPEPDAASPAEPVDLGQQELTMTQSNPQEEETTYTLELKAE